MEAHSSSYEGLAYWRFSPDSPVNFYSFLSSKIPPAEDTQTHIINTAGPTIASDLTPDAFRPVKVPSAMDLGRRRSCLTDILQSSSATCSSMLSRNESPSRSKYESTESHMEGHRAEPSCLFTVQQHPRLTTRCLQSYPSGQMNATEERKGFEIQEPKPLHSVLRKPPPKSSTDLDLARVEKAQTLISRMKFMSSSDGDSSDDDEDDDDEGYKADNNNSRGRNFRHRRFNSHKKSTTCLNFDRNPGSSPLKVVPKNSSRNAPTSRDRSNGDNITSCKFGCNRTYALKPTRGPDITYAHPGYARNRHRPNPHLRRHRIGDVPMFDPNLQIFGYDQGTTSITTYRVPSTCSPVKSVWSTSSPVKSPSLGTTELTTDYDSNEDCPRARADFQAGEVHAPDGREGVRHGDNYCKDDNGDGASSVPVAMRSKAQTASFGSGLDLLDGMRNLFVGFLASFRAPSQLQS
jgi:hypothetical protein